MTEYDRISELPENLLTEILSHLTTKDSVKTSVLSTRWKSLWLNVPKLDLNYRDFPYEEEQDFINFIDRVLNFNTDLRLKTFKVDFFIHREKKFSVGPYRYEMLKERISIALSRRVEHLNVTSRYLSCINILPTSVYTSKTLVSLSISYLGLEDPGFFYMPSLKFMYLKLIQWRGTMNMEKIIAGCPFLEKLTVHMYGDEAILSVRSRSLKWLYVMGQNRRGWGSEMKCSILEIDAPRLEYMIVKVGDFDRYVIKDLTSLISVDLDIKFHYPKDLSKRNEIYNLLIGISSVRDMCLSCETTEAFDAYSELGPIFPTFNNLTRLQIESYIPTSFSKALFKCCPNLKNLIVEFEYPHVYPRIVPHCLLPTFECVEIKGRFHWEEEGKKFASYFLENSPVLKKLRVSLSDCFRDVSDSDIYEELNQLAKLSQICQIVIIHHSEPWML